jgi:hypothetical protein
MRHVSKGDVTAVAVLSDPESWIKVGPTRPAGRGDARAQAGSGRGVTARRA